MESKSDKDTFKHISILIAVLTLISTWFVCNTVILPNVDERVQVADRILSGQMAPPHQYRVLKPLLARVLQISISPLIHSIRIQHAMSYSALLFVAFAGIFSFFYVFLRNFFTKRTAITGILLLQVVIPLSVTGRYMEGDFITLLFYVVGLNLILCRKDAYLPLVICLGTFNREQMIFLVVFYAIHLISQQELFDKRNILVVSSCVGAYLAVFLGLRLYFGFKAGGHTMSFHIARNTDWYHVLRFILPLWLAEVAGFVVLCALAFKKTNTFFKLSFLSLGLYGLLFFLSGNLWELAKFLPAFLIMIPMSLQILTGEFADEKVRGVATSN